MNYSTVVPLPAGSHVIMDDPPTNNSGRIRYASPAIALIVPWARDGVADVPSVLDAEGSQIDLGDTVCCTCNLTTEIDGDGFDSVAYCCSACGCVVRVP